MIVREADAELLEQFYRGLYMSAFAEQREPLEAWQAALAGEAPYRFHLRVAFDGDELVGGVAYEMYPRSRCGFVTYMVVAPAMRGRGLGEQLQRDAARALYADGARAVFSEHNDPRVPHAYESADVAWQRIRRSARWGNRIVDVRYIQPALGPGLERDRGLCLMIKPGEAPLPAAIPGEVVRDFIAELFDVTERTEPDAELRELLAGIPDQVALIEAW